VREELKIFDYTNFIITQYILRASIAVQVRVLLYVPEEDPLGLKHHFMMKFVQSKTVNYSRQ